MIVAIASVFLAALSRWGRFDGPCGSYAFRANVYTTWHNGEHLLNLRLCGNLNQSRKGERERERKR